MWNAYKLAKACFCRPSDLFGIKGDYRAYCFDEAVIHFGEWLDGELSKATSKAKTEQAAQGMYELVLKKILGEMPGEKGQYATPVATMKAG